MKTQYKIETPITEKEIRALKVGDKVLISGKVYTARDAAHKNLIELIKAGKALPIDLKGQTIYYCGPTPARPGKVIGAAGPTTSGRMDRYAEPLIKLGLKAMIGKGRRSAGVRETLKRYKAIYFAATGGAGALLSKRIKNAKVVAYPELGPEAIYELELKDFPVIVANDIHGRDIFEEGVKQYEKK
jgi:fumarate hydratase subunit beta